MMIPIQDGTWKCFQYNLHCVSHEIPNKSPSIDTTDFEQWMSPFWCPGIVAQFGATSHTPKWCRFDLWSGQYLGCRFVPHGGYVQEAIHQCTSLSSSLSLSLSLFLVLPPSVPSSLKSINISSGGNTCQLFGKGNVCDSTCINQV